MRLLLLLLSLSCAPVQRPWGPPVDRQAEAIRVVLDVFQASDLANMIHVEWRNDCAADGTFDSGMSVGRVEYVLKNGITQLCAGSPLSATKLAHVIGHRVCEGRKWGPDPRPTLAWHRDYGHTLPWVWGPGGLVERSNARLKAAGL